MNSPAEELCLLSNQQLASNLASIGVQAARDSTPVANLKLSPNDLRALCNPGVYIFWKDKRALYVGVGRRVINRISSRNHGAVGRALRECTSIEIIFFANGCEAAAHEAQLIADLQPTLNRRGLGNMLQEAE